MPVKPKHKKTSKRRNPDNNILSQGRTTRIMDIDKKLKYIDRNFFKLNTTELEKVRFHIWEIVKIIQTNIKVSELDL